MNDHAFRQGSTDAGRTRLTVTVLGLLVMLIVLFSPVAVHAADPRATINSIEHQIPGENLEIRLNFTIYDMQYVDAQVLLWFQSSNGNWVYRDNGDYVSTSVDIIPEYDPSNWKAFVLSVPVAWFPVTNGTNSFTPYVEIRRSQDQKVLGSKFGNRISITSQQRTGTLRLNPTTYVPPITYGDADFDTGDGDPMDVRVFGAIRIEGNSLITEVCMYGDEVNGDTTVDGCDRRTVYTAPIGWQIASITPTTPSTYSAQITTHGSKTYRNPNGDQVAYFVVQGDRKGDEAGNWTRVIVYWRPLQITLQRIES